MKNILLREARDTDWFITLMDVDEENNIFHLVRGTIRTRFRNPHLLQAHKIISMILRSRAVGLW